MLREQESGATTAEVCCRHGISEQTFYCWKTKYGGMSPSDAQRLKSLEDENRRLRGPDFDQVRESIAVDTEDRSPTRT